MDFKYEWIKDQPSHLLDSWMNTIALKIRLSVEHSLLNDLVAEFQEDSGMSLNSYVEQWKEMSSNIHDYKEEYISSLQITLGKCRDYNHSIVDIFNDLYIIEYGTRQHSAFCNRHNNNNK